MQENELEKNIRNKMEEFALVPDAQVWTEVSKRIANNKKKRRLAYAWFLLGILLVGGAAGFIFVNRANNANSLTNKPTLNEAIVKPGTIKEKPLEELKQPQVAEEKKTAEERESVLVEKQAEPYLRKEIALAKTKRAFAGKETDETPLKKQQVAIPVQKTTPDLSKEILGSKAAITKNTSKSTRQERGELPLHKYYGIDKKNENLQVLTPKAVVTEAKPEKTKALSKQSKKSWTIGFTASAGVSNNRTNFPLLSSGSNDQFSAPTQNNTPGTVNNASFRPLNYTANFSFSLGGYIQKSVYKRLSLSLGVNYRYFSANSATGSQVNVQTTLNDSALETSRSFNSYFINGTAVSYKNTYHFLQLPTLLNYRLNKNEQKPVMLTAGITPGYLIGSNALYANRNRRIYYREKKQFSNLHIFAETSLSIPIINQKKFNISAGPTFQYGINNLTKGVTGTNQHLFFTGIKTNITLK